MVAFVHVPKTAGSLVNAALAAQRGRGRDHIEHLLDNGDRLRDVARQSSWLSGHVPVDVLMARLNAHSVPVAGYYSAMRRPRVQIASHYNWLIEIRHRSPGFFAGHPAHIREISDVIAASDNADPRAVMRNLERYGGLFLNTQSRFLCADAVSGPSGAIRRFAFVGTEQTIPQLLTRMGAGGFDLTRRTNSSQQHIDPTVFGMPELREFLAAENADDDALYAQVQEVFEAGPMSDQAAQKRRPAPAGQGLAAIGA